jgi:hypothetical protein
MQSKIEHYLLMQLNVIEQMEEDLNAIKIKYGVNSKICLKLNSQIIKLKSAHNFFVESFSALLKESKLSQINSTVRNTLRNAQINKIPFSEALKINNGFAVEFQGIYDLNKRLIETIPDCNFKDQLIAENNDIKPFVYDKS